jgi:CRP/FNR family transcriptional regulator, cyclic AMP receptor protein
MDLKTGSSLGTADAQLDELLHGADAALRVALHDHGTTVSGFVTADADDPDDRIASLSVDRRQETTRAQIDAITHKVGNTVDALLGRVEDGTFLGPGLSARQFGTELTDQEWADLLRRGRPRRLPAGTPLFIEGSRSDTVVIVISGRVKVFTSAEDGTEVVLAMRGPGALLGDLAVIDGQPHSASVRSLEATEVLTVGFREFTEFLHTHPRTMWLVMRMLTDRLRDADRKRIEFGVYDTLNRVACRLVELADRFGEPTESGIRITLPLTQEDLASWVGASREAVTKALRTLRTDGYVRTQRRTVTVIDIERLRRRTS